VVGGTALRNKAGGKVIFPREIVGQQFRRPDADDIPGMKKFMGADPQQVRIQVFSLMVRTEDDHGRIAVFNPMVKGSGQDQIQKMVFLFGKFTHGSNLQVAEGFKVSYQTIVVEFGITVEPDMKRDAVAV